ncbi:MAG: hypothetical protein LBB35_04230, partial [Coriobacteriaceae bacterium]|nr:hypothetical protein [Coriobacteriaceae bacterium]
MEQNNTRNNREQRGARNNRNTRSFKHVELQRERPHLTRGENQAQTNERSKTNNRPAQKPRQDFNSAKKDPNALLRIIPLGGLDGIGKNMTVI